MAYIKAPWVLPTGESMNPAQPETAKYFNKEQVAYVLFKLNDDRTRPTRVLTSYGSLGFAIGDQLVVSHDQTRRYLGDYRIVGIVDFSTGVKVGDVPNRPIAHCVAK